MCCIRRCDRYEIKCKIVLHWQWYTERDQCQAHSVRNNKRAWSSEEMVTSHSVPHVVFNSQRALLAQLVCTSDYYQTINLLPKLAESFTKLCIVKSGMLGCQLSSGFLCPNHEGIHRPFDSHFFLYNLSRFAGSGNNCHLIVGQNTSRRFGNVVQQFCFIHSSFCRLESWGKVIWTQNRVELAGQLFMYRPLHKYLPNSSTASNRTLQWALGKQNSNAV